MELQNYYYRKIMLFLNLFRYIENARMKGKVKFMYFYGYLSYMLLYEHIYIYIYIYTGNMHFLNHIYLSSFFTSSNTFFAKKKVMIGINFFGYNSSRQ